MSAIDMKKLMSPKYSIYRILRSPGPWAQIYRERMKRFGKIKGALIFPEFVIGLEQRLVYQASVQSNSVGISSSLGSLRVELLDLSRSPPGSTRLSPPNRKLTSLQDVLNFEEDNQDATSMSWLNISMPSGPMIPFIKTDGLFTNKQAAAKWVAGRILTQIGEVH